MSTAPTSRSFSEPLFVEEVRYLALIRATNAIATSEAAGASCAYVVHFAPNSVGALSGSLALRTNNLNAKYATQRIGLSGTAIKATPSMTIPPVSIHYGATPTKLTVSVAYAGALAPSRAVTIKVGSGASLTAKCTGTASPRTCSVSYATGALATGGHTITATIASDANYDTASKTGSLADKRIGPVKPASVQESWERDGGQTVA
jgi:hypothetical protein